MKKLFLLLLLLVSSGLTLKSHAQVSVNINIGAQPAWGPTGYDYVDYYYLPDIESYYYVPKKQFIYLGSGGWVFTTALPPRYRGYDLYNGYKVVINSPQPYRYFENHKVKYAKFKGNHGQSAIGKSKGRKYSAGNSNADFYKGGKGKPSKAQHFNKGNGNGKGRNPPIWRVFFFNFFFVVLGQKVWPILNPFLFWPALEELFRYCQQFLYCNKHS